MLKMYANGERDGRPLRLVLLGLSHANIAELVKGRPIRFGGETIGFGTEVEFLIFTGENEKAMMREFAQFVGPETEVHIDPRLQE